jgi:hypothetical protein
VKVGLAITALTVVYAWPLIRGYGASATLPSALPLDYGRNTVLALLVVWTIVGIWAGTALTRRGKGRA